MRFSQRHGYNAVRTVAQVESMDDELRTDLWNAIHDALFRATISDPLHWGKDFLDEIFYPIWCYAFLRDGDEYPSSVGHLSLAIKEVVKSGDWFDVYDLLEEILQSVRESKSAASGAADNLTADFNYVLEANLAGYRLIGGEVAPIVDEVELKEIEVALSSEEEAVRAHLKQALSHLADRKEPDYPNSVKESLSAVESMAKSITGKSPLSLAIKELTKDQDFNHPALTEAWNRMYGWAGDADGIRHGGSDTPRVTQELARYILIVSSAFINLLTALQAKKTTPPNP